MAPLFSHVSVFVQVGILFQNISLSLCTNYLFRLVKLEVINYFVCKFHVQLSNTTLFFFVVVSSPFEYKIVSLVTQLSGRCGGLMLSALDSGARTRQSGFEPWPGTLCCVLGHSHSASLHPGVFNAGGNPAMDFSIPSRGE